MNDRNVYVSVNVTNSGDETHRPHRRLHICLGTPVLTRKPPPRSKGIKVSIAIQLQDDETASFPIFGVDEFNNQTTVGLGPVTATSSDPTIATATVDANNNLVLTPLPKLGACQVLLSTTAGSNAVNQTINLTVGAGNTVGLGLGTPTTTPIPAPAPAPITGQAKK